MPRHTDITATLGPNGFVPYREPRRIAHRDCSPSCSCRTSPSAAKRSSTDDVAAKLTTKLQDIARKAVRSTGTFQRMSDSLDRLDGAIDGARAAVDLRRTTGFRGRV